MKNLNEKHVVPFTEHSTANGNEEIAFTGRGVVLLTFFLWRDDKMPKAREALRRYCHYLAAHGYGVGGTKIWRELESMDPDCGADWIEDTYSKYVENDRSVIDYMLGADF